MIEATFRTDSPSANLSEEIEIEVSHSALDPASGLLHTLPLTLAASSATPGLEQKAAGWFEEHDIRESLEDKPRNQAGEQARATRRAIR